MQKNPVDSVEFRNKKIDEILDNISIRTNEIFEQAKETNLLLSHQSEQLENIETKVASVDDNIIAANKKINKMLSEKSLSFINGLSTGAVIGGITIGVVGVGLGSIPIVGVSLVVTGIVATGTIVINKVNSVFF